MVKIQTVLFLKMTKIAEAVMLQLYLFCHLCGWIWSTSYSGSGFCWRRTLWRQSPLPALTGQCMMHPALHQCRWQHKNQSLLMKTSESVTTNDDIWVNYYQQWLQSESLPVTTSESITNTHTHACVHGHACTHMHMHTYMHSSSYSKIVHAPIIRCIYFWSHTYIQYHFTTRWLLVQSTINRGDV